MYRASTTSSTSSSSTRLAQRGLRLGLGVLGDRHVVERLAVERGDVLEVAVVAHDADDLDRHALRPLAVQQVDEAVRGLGHHDQRADAPADDVELSTSSSNRPATCVIAARELVARTPSTRPARA